MKKLLKKLMIVKLNTEKCVRKCDYYEEVFFTTLLNFVFYMGLISIPLLFLIESSNGLINIEYLSSAKMLLTVMATLGFSLLFFSALDFISKRYDLNFGDGYNRRNKKHIKLSNRLLLISSITLALSLSILLSFPNPITASILFSFIMFSATTIAITVVGIIEPKIRYSYLKLKRKHCGLMNKGVVNE